MRTTPSTAASRSAWSSPEGGASADRNGSGLVITRFIMPRVAGMHPTYVPQFPRWCDSDLCVAESTYTLQRQCSTRKQRFEHLQEFFGVKRLAGQPQPLVM